MSAPTDTSARALLDRFNWLDAVELAARVEAVLAEAMECDKAGCGMDPELVLRLLNGVTP